MVECLVRETTFRRSISATKSWESGWLKEGYDADFIALEHNPLEDIEILSDPRNVTHVWKGGKLYKANGNPISFLD